MIATALDTVDQLPGVDPVEREEAADFLIGQAAGLGPRQGWHVQLARNGYPHLIPPTSIDPTRRPRQHHRFQVTQISSRRRT